MCSTPDLWARCARLSLRASTGAGALALLTACGTPLLPVSAQEAQPSAAPITWPALSTSWPSLAEGSPVSPPPAPPGASQAAADGTDTVVRLLAYADRVRKLPTAELAQEAARLGNAPTPAAQLQLALVLSQLHQTPELMRAQELLNRVINSSAADAQPLQPLARLLAARYGEQRRLEDQLDKQTQQTRDVQRRLDQTHERLEALKAIERSLTSRPPAAPASRTRPAAP